MSAKQNKSKTGLNDARSRPATAPSASRRPALDGTEYEIDLGHHAVRSPESAKNAIRSQKVFLDDVFVNE